VNEKEINEALLRMSMEDPNWDGQGKSMREEADASMRVAALVVLISGLLMLGIIVALFVGWAN
jgi:hypothetical protein